VQSVRSRVIYASYRLFGSPFDSSTPLAQQRAYIERQGKFSIMPSKVDVQPVSIGEMYAEWVKPHGVRHDQAILYLHGGGYTMGSCNTHRPLASRIAIASQTPALLVNYRLAPENPFPAALEDAKAAFQWLLDQGIEARRIVIVGDSAGAVWLLRSRSLSAMKRDNFQQVLFVSHLGLISHYQERRFQLAQELIHC